ncbi:uncharacterized protein GGS25DRAFT_502188 [Hypoxylon fragiforme]|uniref:uncharacterized protein n=1 Tax=Hypoxylon fragiforme TaxID=63214 RepID=UPI0020C5CF63|nr:uncharacterized protein GGS25DRAFT_502188 [Hypoxylon fragiforme]KAI2604845.1 hypothetical protein GGS25DRAFT_502188 [Hypoxylon fragiforme]
MYSNIFYIATLFLSYLTLQASASVAMGSLTFRKADGDVVTPAAWVGTDHPIEMSKCPKSDGVSYHQFNNLKLCERNGVSEAFKLRRGDGSVHEYTFHCAQQDGRNVFGLCEGGRCSTCREVQDVWRGFCGFNLHYSCD